MADNEIKTLQFNQGVALIPAPVILDDSGSKSLSNNVGATDTGLSFDGSTAREVVIDYQIYRKTDTPFETVEVGQLRLSARPIGATKWVLTQPLKVDDGSDAGVTFSISIVGLVVSLKYATTNKAGANHVCSMYYAIKTILS